MTGNEIGDEGAKAMCEMLKVNNHTDITEFGK